jgi:hypothetical protein
MSTITNNTSQSGTAFRVNSPLSQCEKENV